MSELPPSTSSTPSSTSLWSSITQGLRRLFSRRKKSPLNAVEIPDNATEATALVMAMRGYHAIALEYFRERRGESQWKWFKRGLITVISGTSFVLFVTEYFNRAGTTPGFLKDEAAAVVTIRGAIGEDTYGKASIIIPRLTKAFHSSRTKVVILRIDTPGGSPTDAERIYKTLEDLKHETGKPVIAVIEGVGASAGYMIAMHADKVYSGQYSLVGSIGAFLSTWDASGFIAEHNVKQNSFASGPLKTMGQTFAAMTPEQAKKAQAIVDHLGEMFAADFLKAREGKLKQPSRYYTSGEVWHGDQALAIGLVDGIKSVEAVAREYDAPISEYGPAPAPPFAGGFLSSFVDAVARSVVTQVRSNGVPSL